MTNKTILTQATVSNLADRLAEDISVTYPSQERIYVYGVPRGGISAAYLVSSFSDKIVITDDIDEADCIIDDLIDSGATVDRYATDYPHLDFFALIDKRNHPVYKDQWIVFPWEQSAESSITDNIVRLLQFVGENPSREGLLETPKRVAKAWQFWTSGYSIKAEDILKVFEDGAEGCDEMVVRKDIPIYSHCEHHLAAIIGKCTIAYIPDGKVVGLSKMDRLADMFARRLQVQERMTNQIADAMFDILAPKGVGVWISARHLCVESRGVCNHNSDTVTCALRGVFKDQPETRAEFLALARS